MKGVPLSRAASGLVRALLARSGKDRDRILLSEVRSVDWQSLTFTGERHVISLRIVEPDAAAIAARLTAGLEHAEFEVAGHIVADIEAKAPHTTADKSVLVVIEALTLCA